MECEDVGGVGPGTHGDGLRVEAVLGQQPVVAVGCDLAGEVGVGGHDRLLAVVVGVVGELAGLVFGEGGPERGEADEPAAAGDGDGEGVHGAFDQDGGGAGGEQVGADGVQLGAFVEQGRVGGVEVLRPGVFVAQLGVAAADEPEQLGLAGGGWCR